MLSMPAGATEPRRPISDDQPAVRPSSSAATDGRLPAAEHGSGGLGPRYSRRSLLRTGIFGGAATLIAAAGTGAVSTTALAAGASPPSLTDSSDQCKLLAIQSLRALGGEAPSVATSWVGDKLFMSFQVAVHAPPTCGAVAFRDV